MSILKSSRKAIAVSSDASVCVGCFILACRIARAHLCGVATCWRATKAEYIYLLVLHNKSFPIWFSRNVTKEVKNRSRIVSAKLKPDHTRKWWGDCLAKECQLFKCLTLEIISDMIRCADVGYLEQIEVSKSLSIICGQHIKQQSSVNKPFLSCICTTFPGLVS